MPSHYNYCVPLCTNYTRKNPNLSFYRIPKDVQLRKEYRRLIRNKTLKFSHLNLLVSFQGRKEEEQKSFAFDLSME